MSGDQVSAKAQALLNKANPGVESGDAAENLRYLRLAADMGLAECGVGGRRGSE